MNIQRLTEEYTILWFEFDLCGFQNLQERDNISTTVTTARNGSAC